MLTSVASVLFTLRLYPTLSPLADYAGVGHLRPVVDRSRQSGVLAELRVQLIYGLIAPMLGRTSVPTLAGESTPFHATRVRTTGGH
jgi:hypothetical protein